jgi:hypothetical protein
MEVEAEVQAFSLTTQVMRYKAVVDLVVAETVLVDQLPAIMVPPILAEEVVVVLLVMQVLADLGL